MSKDKWDGLSTDQQTAITDAATEATDWGADLYEKEAATAVETMREAGIEITTPDLEPFREATQSVYDKHADTIGADLIDAIRNA